MLSKTKVKYIQTLYQKKNREEEGLFIAEGPKIVNEIISAFPEGIAAIYALETWQAPTPAVLPLVTVVTTAELGQLSALSTPNQLLAVVRQFTPAPLPDAHQEPVLALDGIQDPGNLGTLIRIADWFGLRHVVCSPGSAEVYNPKVVQATMGSLLRVRVHYTPLAPYLEAHRRAGIWAAVLNGEPLAGVPAFHKGVLLIGNESKGIDAALLPLVTKRISIPGKGGAESLNAAVAAGIILSHIVG